MVKFYKNRYIRKYQEDFLLSFFSKQTAMTSLGQTILQKYKYTTFSSMRRVDQIKRMRLVNIRKTMRYLFLRLFFRYSFLWFNSRKLLSLKKKKRKFFKYLAIKKFQHLFLKLLLLNRTTVLCKNLQFFSKYLSSLFKIKMHHYSFVNMLHLVLVLQQNNRLYSFINLNSSFASKCTSSRFALSSSAHHISKSRLPYFKVSKDSLFYLNKPAGCGIESFDFFFATLPIEESCDVPLVSNIVSFNAEEYFYIKETTA